MLSSVLVFLAVLSVLILVHELGHFIAARKFGVWVEEFGFGLPPRILGKKIKGTIYSLNLLPFGGFVKLHGENNEGEIKNSKLAFLSKSKKVRTLIVIAGVLMNFVLAFVAFSVVYTFSGIPKKTNNVRVIEVSSASPAQEAGFIVGDVIKKIDGEEVSDTTGFISLVEKNKGKKVEIEVSRKKDGEEITKKLKAIPREISPQGEGPLGVVISSAEIYYPPLLLRPFYGAYYGSREGVFWGRNVILGLSSTVAQLFKGKAPSDIAGPVGIFAVTSETARYGVLAVINFVGILSINLAVLNIIPFPALDGGRLLFIFLEKLLGRKVLPKLEATIHTVGMIILLVLILAITVSDVRKLISAGSISNFLENIVK